MSSSDKSQGVSQLSTGSAHWDASNPKLKDSPDGTSVYDDLLNLESAHIDPDLERQVDNFFAQGNDDVHGSVNVSSTNSSDSLSKLKQQVNSLFAQGNDDTNGSVNVSSTNSPDSLSKLKQQVNGLFAQGNDDTNGSVNVSSTNSPDSLSKLKQQVNGLFAQGNDDTNGSVNVSSTNSPDSLSKLKQQVNGFFAQESDDANGSVNVSSTNSTDSFSKLQQKVNSLFSQESDDANGSANVGSTNSTDFVSNLKQQVNGFFAQESVDANGSANGSSSNLTDSFSELASNIASGGSMDLDQVANVTLSAGGEQIINYMAKNNLTSLDASGLLQVAISPSTTSAQKNAAGAFLNLNPANFLVTRINDSYAISYDVGSSHVSQTEGISQAATDVSSGGSISPLLSSTTSIDSDKDVVSSYAFTVGKTNFNQGDLTQLASNTSAPPDAQAAARRLLAENVTNFVCTLNGANFNVSMDIGSVRVAGAGLANALVADTSSTTAANSSNTSTTSTLPSTYLSTASVRTSSLSTQYFAAQMQSWMSANNKSTITMDQLKNLAADATSTAAVRGFAQYFVDNPDQFTIIETLDSPKADNIASFSDVQAVANSSVYISSTDATSAQWAATEIASYMSYNGMQSTSLTQLQDWANYSNDADLRRAAQFMVGCSTVFNELDTMDVKTPDNVIGVDTLRNYVKTKGIASIQMNMVISDAGTSSDSGGGSTGTNSGQ
ncbi:hypothetical protein AWB78_07732 [Caballeronia calidae]|uniref:Uncharacterized protein n=1 Tax=Caballeronia calidae TaxID=1777139 RepID=A0A158EGC3_9BURK|nr:hypothetical protein [Caballeronia calidae]SAL05843.1 hypothetical protein AWB78_07732 [Caballeronia calidae]